ncbi:hypothetical protein ACFX2I_039775 [Malus domestica]
MTRQRNGAGDGKKETDIQTQRHPKRHRSRPVRSRIRFSPISWYCSNPQSDVGGRDHLVSSGKNRTF